jgi:serine/threonine-protein kinase
MQNTIIKDYQIHSELGRGGMATVYLAHDNKFDTNVAVKVLNKEFVHNENIRKRFLAEAKNMFKMSHPNIIKVIDLIEEGDNVAMVMEYIEGETLKDYIDRRGKLSDEEIKNLFSQMLNAVGYVHKQKLVHRDIKPSNFMINLEGQIKLMDFGIAKTTDLN